MNAISSRYAVAAVSRPSLRADTAIWLTSIAACQRRLSDRADTPPGCRASLISRASENELASHALLCGDTIVSIRQRLSTMRGGKLQGGQLGEVLDVLEVREAGR